MIFLSQLPQVLEAQNVEMAELGLQPVHILLFEFLVGIPNNMFDRFRSVQNIRERFDEGGIQENSIAFGLHNRMRQSLLAKGIVRGNDSQGLGCGTYLATSQTCAVRFTSTEVGESRIRTVRHRQPVCAAKPNVSFHAKLHNNYTYLVAP